LIITDYEKEKEERIKCQGVIDEVSLTLKQISEEVNQKEHENESLHNSLKLLNQENDNLKLRIKKQEENIISIKSDYSISLKNLEQKNSSLQEDCRSKQLSIEDLNNNNISLVKHNEEICNELTETNFQLEELKTKFNNTVNELQHEKEQQKVTYEKEKELMINQNDKQIKLMKENLLQKESLNEKLNNNLQVLSKE
jgi:hypothetical protein